MNIKFIINPISGKGKQKGIEKHIAKYFNDYQIEYTNNTGDATRISRDAVNKNFNKVIAVGGDGTVNECIKSLINTNVALGVIPCGSGNGFAYHIGMDQDTKKAVKQLQDTSIEVIDSCIANKMPFVNVSGIGFDAHIAQLFAKLKNRGFASYIMLIFKELNYLPQKYNIQYDGISRSINAYMISFANSSQYGNNVKISPTASIKDGLLDFVIIKKIPKWKIPLLIIKIATGKIHTSNNVEIIKCKEMKITANKTLIHLDGEPYRFSSPITIKVLPNSLKILMPNEK